MRRAAVRRPVEILEFWDESQTIQDGLLFIVSKISKAVLSAMIQVEHY
jgi:hypothetical protein